MTFLVVVVVVVVMVVVVVVVVVVDVELVDLGLFGLEVVESLAHPLNSVVVLVLNKKT